MEGSLALPTACIEAQYLGVLAQHESQANIDFALCQAPTPLPTLSGLPQMILKTREGHSFVDPPHHLIQASAKVVC